MRPELFRILDVSFPAYFVLLLTGFAFATAIGVIWTRRIGHNPDVVVDLALAMLLAGVVGGRFFHVLFDGYFWDYVNLCVEPSAVDWKITKAQCLSERYDGIWDPAAGAAGVCHPKTADCWAWAKFWAGGLTYYGGLLAASGVAVYVLRRDRFPFWKAADFAGVAVAVGLGFGRMGCLLAGCCFGQPTDGSLGLSFPAFSPASEAQFKLGELTSSSLPSLPVLPTQIFESAVSFGVAAVCLLLVQGRKRYDGEVFVVFIVLYAIGRFVLEIFRADDRGGVLGISTSQWVGLLVVAAAVALHLYRMKHRWQPR